MHELSITQSVVDTVSERTAGATVTGVHLVIGRLSGVVPDSVRFCFELVTAGTPLEQAHLEISQPGGRVHCRTCDGDFDTDDLILLCRCGSADVTLVSGDELLIRSVEVA